MRDFVHHEIGERVAFSEILERDVARRLLAETHDARCSVSEKLGAQAVQVEVREVPGGLQPVRLPKHRLEIVRREKDDGTLENAEHKFSLASWKQSAHHWFDLAP